MLVEFQCYEQIDSTPKIYQKGRIWQISYLKRPNRPSLTPWGGRGRLVGRLIDVSIFSGQSIRCYSCIGSGSWKSCESDIHKVQCDNTAKGCLSMYATYKENPEVRGFAKGCAKTCTKEDIPGCRSGEHLNCVVQCCHSDFCNVGPSLIASLPFKLASTCWNLHCRLGQDVFSPNFQNNEDGVRQL